MFVVLRFGFGLIVIGLVFFWCCFMDFCVVFYVVCVCLVWFVVGIVFLVLVMCVVVVEVWFVIDLYYLVFG